MRTKKASASGILALVDRIEKVAKTLERLCKCVWGNGVPGILNDVTVIKAQLDIMKWVIGGCVTGIVIPLVLFLAAKLFHIQI
jgi:hypothetical protein